ncbi:unnamed protein product, partial [Toxocara canis]|uniref:Transcription elongation regulator 1 n=1 Tax=Toxocara canis TaxID=6265 RepID=A0A183TYZ3_TOXCA
MQDVCKKLWGVEVKEETLRRLRRALAQYREYLHWMTDEQFKAIENMKEEGASTQQLHAKVKEYFKKLPMEKQEMIKNEFKTKCVAWIKDVATDEQIEELKTLHHDGDLTTLHAKIDSYFAKLSSPRQDEVGRLRALCKEAWGVSAPSRTRREIDAKYKEWIAWMTDAQRSELESMRAGGSSFDEIHEKINGYFKELEADRRKELIKEYKAKCKEYFAAISTEDEMNEVCYDVYHKAAARRMRRRDIDALMNKHLSWLTDEQKHQIKRMKQDGESTGSIKAKCVREYVQRLSPEKQAAVNRDLDICEHIWYGGHVHNSHHRHLRRHLTERKRRDTKHEYTLEHALETHLSWLTEEQKERLKEMKATGKSRSEMQHEVMHYYDQLHGEAKHEATEKIKAGCKMLLKGIVGEQKVAQLKQMKEAGSSTDELKEKVQQMLSE